MMFKDVKNRYSKGENQLVKKNYPVNNVNSSLFSFGFDFINTLESDKALITAFQSTPEVYGVVNYMASMMSKVPIKMYDKKNKEIETHNILTLLNNPNYFQSGKELLKMLYAYDLVTGNSYLNAFAPYAMKPDKLFILPSQNIQILTKNHINNADFRTNEVVSYKLYQSGKTSIIQANNVMHRKAVNLNFDGGNYLLGISPLFSAKLPINSLLASYEAQLSIYQNRGAMGALTSKTAELPITNKQELLNDYFNTYGLGAGKHKILISQAPLEYIQMGLPVTELQLNESNISNYEAVCTALAFPAPLLKNTGASTRDNITAFKQQLWNNNLMPKLDDFCFDLTNFFKLFWKEDFTLKPDYSNIDELKKDDKTEVEVLKNEIMSGIKTPNEGRLQRGLVESKQEGMNDYYLLQGLKKVREQTPKNPTI